MPEEEIRKEVERALKIIREEEKQKEILKHNVVERVKTRIKKRYPFADVAETGFYTQKGVDWLEITTTIKPSKFATTLPSHSFAELRQVFMPFTVKAPLSDVATLEEAILSEISRRMMQVSSVPSGTRIATDMFEQPETRKIYQCEICSAQSLEWRAKELHFVCPKDGGKLKQVAGPV